MNMLVDVVAIAVVLASTLGGYRRGALLTLLHLGGLAAAYVAAYRFSATLAPGAQVVFGLSYFGARLAAGAVIFLAVSVTTWLLARGAARRRRARVAEGRPPVALDSRLVGAALGLAAGVAAVTACCWVYSAMRVGALGQRLPDISPSYSARATRTIVGEVTYAVVRARGGSEQRALTMSRLLGSPEEAIRELKALFEEPSLRDLLQSRVFLEDFLSGEQARILANADLQRLLADEPVMERLSRFGLVPSDYRRPGFAEDLAARLARLGGRIRAIRDDPETGELVRAFEAEGKLTWNGLLGLLRDRRFHRLLDRVFAPDGDAT